MKKIKEYKRLSNGYMSFDYEEKHYYDYHEKGNDPNCIHKTYKEVTSKSSVNKYCQNCGYRKLFILYAKYK